MFGKDKINDPYNTMGDSGTPRRDNRPAHAAHRDTDRRKSDWLTMKQADAPSTKACGTCKGTGSSGWLDGQGRLIVCPDCRGFGY